MSNRRVISNINVTPLVDVMLVLLVIFMLTTPMMEQGIDISLPETTALALPKNDEPLIIFINKKQQIYLNKKRVPRAELGKKLKAIKKSRPDVTVVVKADKTIPYGTFAKILAQINMSGLTKIGLATEPETN